MSGHGIDRSDSPGGVAAAASSPAAGTGLGSLLGSFASLTDPGSDKIVFWDESGNVINFLTLGTGITITGTTLNAAGETGATGGVQYTFSTTTSASDPGSGVLRFDNATPASVTNLYFDDLDAGAGADLGPLLALMVAGSVIVAQDANDAAAFLAVSVSSTPTDNTGWWTVPVTVLGAGTLPSNGVTLAVGFAARGGTGATGSTGSTGATGPAVTPGLQTIWIPAYAMYAATTNGAAGGTTESTTNKVMNKVMDFDTTTQEFVQFSVAMPTGWDEGTVTFIPYWTAASGSGGVVWALQGVALSNDDAVDTAFGTEQTSTDTLITALDVHVGPTSAAITIGGTPAAGDLCFFRLKRNVADGSDTLAVDARLLGIKLLYTVNDFNDA